MCNETVTELVSFCEAVADRLDGWNVSTIEGAGADGVVRLSGDRGAVMLLRQRTDKAGIVNVSGRWPGGQQLGHWLGVRSEPALNVSMARPVGSVAQDIRRRFLGRYMRLYRLCLAEVARDQDRVEKIAHKVAAFERIAPMQPSLSPIGAGTRLYLRGYPNAHLGAVVRLVSDDWCHLDLTNVPYGLALRIIDLLESELRGGEDNNGI